ncbi:hypothetical protein LTR84_011773 [Exophiala bonariae]|uniref:J domain-containing protein n=1 Tax=Exophiala bonariae TaxID=1690606 RepID=A0AAV9NGY3_9EURO|nr:hypothetical protein LTR84_011773 [Exophiala bonariae]
MGQRQSTSNTEQEESPAKTDYYELLGVERTATEDEIKKAYRRKALELHPDRNYGNVESTTRLFAEIQSAYEVLSDPQERAWYDSHKDVLLRGDQPTGPGGDEFSYNTRLTTAEEVMKLMMKFNGRVEFNNSPSGFFGGLNDFFKQLAKEEDIACQWEDQEGVEYPDFGMDNDEYEDVVRPFYAVWNGFGSKKSYSWRDQYKLSDAPDRRIRRLMEKENKKLRDDAVQEYNEAVRSLVAFVRKRDPRVQNNQKSEAERQKALRDATAAQAARSRAARQAKLQEQDAAVVPEWAKSNTKDEHEGGFSSESDLEDHEYDCVVCDKTFKSEAQFNAHEKSKKHIKQLKQLQREMRAEGRELNLEKPKEDSNLESSAQDDENVEDGDQEASFVQDDLDSDSYANVDATSESHRRTNGTSDSPAEDAEDSEPSKDDDYASRSDIEQRLTAEVTDQLPASLEDLSLEGTPVTSDTEGSSHPKIGKAKQKRAKKAAQQSVQQPTTGPGEFQCLACKAEFPSKSQLFKHLDKTKHAAPLAQTKAVKGGKGKKR